MCICVNCRWVDRCETYHAVERQHGVEHLTDSPDLEPSSPLIHINVFEAAQGSAGVEWDVRSCSSFQEDYGRWQRLRPDREIPT